MDCDTTHFTTSSKTFSCLTLLLTLSNVGTSKLKMTLQFEVLSN